MGQGINLLAAAYSIVYHDGTGNVRGALYSGITTQGHIVLTDPGPVPTAPAAGKIVLFVEDHAGRVLPATKGPSGIDKNIQPALFGNTNYMWLPGFGTSVSISWSTSWTARNAGTTPGVQSHPTKTSTNSMSSMNRANFTTTIAAASSGIQSTNTVAWLGNASGLGGFLFFARFGIETFTSGSYAVLVGLSSFNGNLGTEPSNGLANTIALCKDTTDSTWQVITRNLSTGGTNGVNYNKINTFISVTVGQILDLYIHSAPNSQSVRFHIKDGVTGADLYVSPSALTVTGTLPQNTVFMYAHAQIQSTVGGTTKALALNTMYIECDL